MLRRIVIALIICISAPVLFAQNDVVAQHLRADFEKRALLLRGFYQDALLRYDTSGALKHHGDTGSWTTSFLYVRSLEVKNDMITIQGNRVVQIFDTKKRRFQARKTELPVVIEVEADGSSNEALIRQALASVFVTANESLVLVVPEYWRSVFFRMNKDGYVEAEPPPERKPSECPQEPSLGDPCRVGKLVKPPKAINTPDPAFSEIARAARLRGTSILETVVDETGRTQNTRVVTPLGCGLDDRAVDAVTRWTFQPSTHEGHPVPVKITVEVNFNWD